MSDKRHGNNQRVGNTDGRSGIQVRLGVWLFKLVLKWYASPHTVPFVLHTQTAVRSVLVVESGTDVVRILRPFCVMCAIVPLIWMARLAVPLMLGGGLGLELPLDAFGLLTTAFFGLVVFATLSLRRVERVLAIGVEGKEDAIGWRDRRTGAMSQVQTGIIRVRHGPVTCAQPALRGSLIEVEIASSRMIVAVAEDPALAEHPVMDIARRSERSIEPVPERRMQFWINPRVFGQ